jgi:hypothetical protein
LPWGLREQNSKVKKTKNRVNFLRNMLERIY